MLLSPDQLIASFDRMRYDKGWEPGPNALWKRKSPDEIANEIHHGPAKEPKPAIEHHQPMNPESVAKMDDAALSKMIGEHKKTVSPIQQKDELQPGKAKDELNPGAAKDELKSTPRQTQLAIQPFEPIGGNVSPIQHPAATPEPKAEKKTQPNSMDMKRAEDAFMSLVGAKTGTPKAVRNAVVKVGKQFNLSPEDMEDAMQQANMAVYNGFVNGTAEKPENFATTVATNATKDYARKKFTAKEKKVQGKSLGGDDEGKGGIDPAAKDGPKSGDWNKAAFDEAVAEMPPEHQKIIDLMRQGHKGEGLADETGLSKATISRRMNEIAEWLRAKGMEHFLHELIEEKDRYVYGPILPQVWDEIIRQAENYGIMGPTFIRSVMEAMRTSDGQYEAIVKGRQAFLAGQRYEYGPRHQPPKRIEGALARLEALMDHADAISEEALADEVDGIAREFDAADLKAIAREFGVKRGLATKLIAVEKILAKICEGRDDD